MITGCLYLSFIIVIIIYLVLFFIKWLYNDFLNFSFCKDISSHPTSICSKLVLLPGALLFTLSISLNKFLLVEIPGTKHLTHRVIVYFTFKICISAFYKKIRLTNRFGKLFISLDLHKNLSFPLRISLVNVTKSAIFCLFGHIYWRSH